MIEQKRVPRARNPFCLMQQGKSHDAHSNHKHDSDAEPYFTSQCRLLFGMQAQFMHAGILSGAPAGRAAIRAEREKLVGWTHPGPLPFVVFPIAIRANFVTDLLAFKNGATMHAAQQQVLGPVCSLTFGAEER